MAIIEHMEVAVPLGTQTGWNVRAAPRAPDLCGLSGAYFPFANTLAERQVTGDPRPSLQERYGSHAGFVQAIMQHAKRLVRERYMLKEDADRYIQAAEASPVLR